jgi:glycosyltransferase involved in cell wall biosynthesis
MDMFTRDYSPSICLGSGRLVSPMTILVVSYVCPPVGEVGGLRVAGFCRYLPHFGICPIVLTVQEQFYQHRDTTSRPPTGIRIERTKKLPTPLDLYARWKGRRAVLRGVDGSSVDPQIKQSPGFIKRQALNLLQIPDPNWGWYWPAIQAGTKLIAREPIAAIFSTGPPWISHLVARHLKKRYRLPWLADFRDPWAYHPVREDFPFWRHWLNQRQEESCIRWADRVLCNTDRLRQFLVQFYSSLPTEKFVSLPNGFEDPIATLSSSQSKPSTRILLHIGSLYANRRVDTFCQGIATLVRTGRLDPHSLKIVFLGEADPSIVDAAYQKAPELVETGCIKFQPRVSWQQAQEALLEADLLLLFQGSNKLEVPAKFFEYLPTGKPILAVVEQGALSDIVESTASGLWVDPGNPAEIAAKLLQALELPTQSPAEVQQRWFGQYHYRALTEKLAGWIRELAAKKSLQNC